MRAFVAIDLPENVRSALAREQAAFRAAYSSGSHHDQGIRWTRPEGVHLTLKFLGEISDERVRKVAEALGGIGRFEKLSIKVRGVGFFPDARRPRVFWAGVEAPLALGELAIQVEDAMERLGFVREQRPFAPHLTLARFKTPRPQPALQALLDGRGELTLGPFEVSEFFLFESKLSPQGAEYRKVERFPR